MAHDPQRGDVQRLPDGRTVRVDFVRERDVLCAILRNGRLVAAPVIPRDRWFAFLDGEYVVSDDPLFDALDKAVR